MTIADINEQPRDGSYEQSLKQRYADIRVRLGGPKPKELRLSRPAVRVQQVRQQWPVPAVAPPPPVAVEKLPEFHTAADRIIAEVADKHGLTVSEVKATRRKAKIVDARYECFYRLSKETEMSLPMLGRKMGGYDHTTVLHGIRTHERRMEEGFARGWIGRGAKRKPVFGVGGWH